MHVQFWKARGEAQKAIRRAKNEWFKAKAEEVESEHFDRKKVWYRAAGTCNKDGKACYFQ